MNLDELGIRLFKICLAASLRPHRQLVLDGCWQLLSLCTLQAPPDKEGLNFQHCCCISFSQAKGRRQQALAQAGFAA